MENQIFRSKSFIIELRSLLSKITVAFKVSSNEQKEENKELFKNYELIFDLSKKGIVEIEKKLPPTSDLDFVFEIVIEKSKIADTKPTIENKQDYKSSLEDFINSYNKSSDKNKELWKDAFIESSEELKIISKKIEEALLVKERVDNLEKVASARVFCIIKGINKDGSEWGRIDFVGQNYVMKHKDKVSKGKDSNNLPLVVKYYSYKDQSFVFEKESNKLEDAFDKQLMDSFLKTPKTSYELFKNFGRDYEYKPELAPIIGSGDWYINISKPSTSEKIAKIIEVPDWNDFGFEDLFQQHLDECGSEILTKDASDILKEKMNQALEKQDSLIQELTTFHLEQNDSDKDTQILIEVWNKRKGSYKESMKTLKSDCIPTFKASEPCTDFQPIYDEHIRKCNANALPKRVGDELKKQMQECINSSRATLKEMQNALDKYKKIPNWESDADTKSKVEELQNQIGERVEEVERQEKDLAALKEECIKPIPLEITFGSANNSIATKNEKQLKEIAIFLINNPDTKIKLIGNTSVPSDKTKNDAWPVNETVETDHLMPDDKFPESMTKEETEELKNRKTNTEDLMMIRAHRVKQLLEDLKVPSSQIIVESGNNLGGDEENQKVVLKYF